MRTKRSLVLLVFSVSLTLLLGLGVYWSVAFATSSTVQVDNAQANEITAGTVVNTDPAAAQVAVTEQVHFWTAVDLQRPPAP